MSVNFIRGVNNIFTSSTNAKNINISAGANELLNITANSVTGLNNITVTQLTGLVPTISNTETYLQYLYRGSSSLGNTVKAMARGKHNSHAGIDFLFVTLPQASPVNSGGLVIYSNTGPGTSFSYLYTINALVPTTNTALNFGNTISVDRYGSGYMIVTELSTLSMFLYYSNEPNTIPWEFQYFYPSNDSIYDSISNTFKGAILSTAKAKIAGNYIISADNTGLVNLINYSVGVPNTVTSLYNNASGAVIAIGITGATTPISAFVQNNYLYVYLGTTIQQVLFLNEAGVDIEFDNTGHYMYVLTSTKFYIYYTSNITSISYMRIHSENSYGGIQLSAYTNSTYNYVSYLYGSNDIVTYVNTISSSQPDLFIQAGNFSTSASSIGCFTMSDTYVFAGDYTTNGETYVYLTTSTNVNVNNIINDGLTDFSSNIPISFNDLYANTAAVTTLNSNTINSTTINGQYNFNFLFAKLGANQNPTVGASYTIPFTIVNNTSFASFNSSTGVLTFLQSGTYLYSANFGITGTGSTTIYVSFYVNSTALTTAEAIVTTSPAYLGSLGMAVYNFSIGDTLIITTYGTGSAYSIFGGGSYTNLILINHF